MIEITHHIYTGSETILHCAEYIHKKLEKFKEKFGIDCVIYSKGVDYNSRIVVVSVAHPIDKFRLKTATDIINGRIKRERGDIPGRIKYSEIKELNEKTGELELIGLPPYIEVERWTFYSKSS